MIRPLQPIPLIAWRVAAYLYPMSHLHVLLLAQQPRYWRLCQDLRLRKSQKVFHWSHKSEQLCIQTCIGKINSHTPCKYIAV